MWLVIHHVLMFLLQCSGDVELNPGMVKYPCGMRGKPVAKNHRALCCDICIKWLHMDV